MIVPLSYNKFFCIYKQLGDENLKAQVLFEDIVRVLYLHLCDYIHITFAVAVLITSIILFTDNDKRHLWKRSENYTEWR